MSDFLFCGVYLGSDLNAPLPILFVEVVLMRVVFDRRLPGFVTPGVEYSVVSVEERNSVGFVCKQLFPLANFFPSTVPSFTNWPMKISQLLP